MLAVFPLALASHDSYPGGGSYNTGYPGGGYPGGYPGSRGYDAGIRCYMNYECANGICDRSSYIYTCVGVSPPPRATHAAPSPDEREE